MVAFTVTMNVPGFMCWVNITGLTVGTRYDIMRMQMRYTGDNDAGVPQYHRELPDRKKLWSSVAHRVGWQAPAANVRFRDYEPLLRPFKYFIVPSTAISPAEYDWRHSEGPYPLSRGTIDDEVIHFNRAAGWFSAEEGQIVIRSTAELGLWATPCVVDFEVGYKARGAEMAVMGREDPMFIADTRESRRGSITVLAKQLGQYHDLRRMLFPQNGRIRPLRLNSGGDATMMLDDMDVIPLDVTVEQATHHDPDMRFITFDFIETDASGLHYKRTGDNDSFTVEPNAAFTVSDTTPARGQWITLTDTSSGQLDEWDWTLSRKSTDNRIAKWATPGPHKVRFSHVGTVVVKLRVNGPQGADATTREIVVH